MTDPHPAARRSPLILGLGGTTRAGSSSETAVRAVLAQAQALGARTRLITGPDLAALPHYDHDPARRTHEQAAFVAAVREADGLVIGSPGYHGGVSGLVKNALDLIEDTRGDARPYLDGRAVGCVVTVAGWQSGGVTLSALRDIVHALRGWPTPLGLALTTSAGPVFDGEGAPLDPAVAAQIALLAEQVVAFARRQAA